MFWDLFGRKVRDMNGLFNGHFVDVKVFYALKFNTVPCVSFIGELDITKAFAFVNSRYKLQVQEVYQHAYFDYDDRKMLFNNTIFVFKYDRVLEMGNNYCQVLHTGKQYDWANGLIKDLSQFRSAATPAKETTRVIGFARQTNEN
jgi:hypothetical protein